MVKVTKDVVVVGAGIGGLVAGVHLREKLGVEDFTIYEREDEVGGTWKVNNYPGCACDVRAHWYSFSEDQNPDWSYSYAGFKEIHDYWLHLVDKHKLRPHIQCNTEFVNAEWDAGRNVWMCHLRTKDGKTQDVETKVLIASVGPFGVPSYPDIPGIDDYQGIKFHSSRWRHDVDLGHKRVAVLGLGASAAQFVPEIAKNETTQITQFIRTPTWFVPRVNAPIPEYCKWIFRNVPGALRVHRGYIYAVSDIRYLFWQNWFAPMRALVEKASLHYMRETAPKKYHEILTPNYVWGCKRVVPDPGYLECLHSPNITLTADGVEAFTKDGIITKKGEHLPFDVVIFGTGFRVGDYIIDVRGTEGLSLSEYYTKYHNDVPVAHLGTTVPTFPNLFMLVGPNIASGHASIVFTIETHVNLIAQLIRPVLERKVAAVAVRRDACDAYNAEIQRRLAQTTFTGCASYYRAGMTGTNFVIFPGPMGLLWWWARAPVWSRYELVGGAAWVRARRRRTLVTLVLVPVALLAVAVTFRPDLLKRVPYIQTPVFVETVDSTHQWINGLWGRIGAWVCQATSPYSIFSSLRWY